MWWFACCHCHCLHQHCWHVDRLSTAVCTALTAVCKLINADLITAVLGPVVKLLEHPKELVRKACILVGGNVGALEARCS
jgi:hypothetical protein